MDQMRYDEVSLTQKHQGKRPEDVATKIDMVGMSDGGGGGETGEDYDKKNKEIFQAAMSSAGLSATTTLNVCAYDGQEHDSSSTEFKMANALLTKCTTNRPFKAVFFAGSADENIVFADVMQSNPGEVSFCIGGYRYSFKITGANVLTEKVFIGESVPETEIWDRYFQGLVGGTDTQLCNIITPGSAYPSGTPNFNTLKAIYDELKANKSLYVTWQYYKENTADKEIIVAPAAIDPVTETIFGISVGNMVYAIEADNVTNPDMFSVRSSSDLRDSEEFKRIFDLINAGNEFYFSSINFAEEGTEYDQTTNAFKAVSNVFYLIKDTTASMMVPWSKIELAQGTEYATTMIGMDPTDTNGLTMKLNAAGNSYKIVLDAATPTKIKAYVVVSEDKRDSIEYDRIFKEITQSDTFVLKDLTVSYEGTEYDTSHPYYLPLASIYDRIRNSGGAGIYGVWSRSNYDATLLGKDWYEIATVPIVRDGSEPGDVMKYSVGGKTYKIVLETGKIIAYILQDVENTRDSIEFDKIFKEMVQDDNFTLSDIEYTEEGKEYSSSTLFYTCVQKLIYYLNENIYFSLHATWRRNTFGTAHPVWDQITNVDVCLYHDDLNTLAFTLGDYTYKLHCDSDKLVAYKEECKDTRDSLEFDRIYIETINDEVFVLSDLLYSVGGTVYNFDSDEFKAIYAIWAKLANSTKVAFNSTWSRFDVDTDTVEITSVPVTLDSMNHQRLSFTVGGNAYILSLEPFTGEPTQLRAQIVEALEDTRDSFEFFKMYKFVTGTEQPLGEIAYSIEGEEYDSTTDVYKIAKTLYDELTAGNICIPAPWGKYDSDPEIPEISFVTVVKDDEPNTLKYSNAGTTYKLVIKDDDTVVAYIVKSDDLRDSEEYDRIFQEILDNVSGDPVRMVRTFNFTTPTTYNSGSTEFTFLNKIRNKLVSLLTSDDRDFIKVTVDETVIGTDHELLINDIFLRSPYVMEFYGHSGVYIITFENDMSKVTTKWQSIDTRDSIVYDKAFQTLLGRTDANKRRMYEVVVDGAEYSTSDPEFNELMTIFDAINSSGGGLYVPWYEHEIMGEKEIHMIFAYAIDEHKYAMDVSGKTYYVDFDNPDAAVKCYIEENEDKRDSLVYNKNYQEFIGAPEDDQFSLSDVTYEVDGYHVEPSDQYFDYLMKTIDYVEGNGNRLSMVTWSVDNTDDEIHVIPATFEAGKVKFAISDCTYSFEYMGSYIEAKKQQITTCEILKYVEVFEYTADAVDDPFYLRDLNYDLFGRFYGSDTDEYRHIDCLINNSGVTSMMVVWDAQEVTGADGNQITEYILAPAHIDNVNGMIRFEVGGTVRYIDMEGDGSGLYAYVKDTDDLRDSIVFTKAFDMLVAGVGVHDYRLINTEFTAEGKVYNSTSDEFKIANRIGSRLTDNDIMMVPYGKTDMQVEGYYTEEMIVLPVIRRETAQGYVLSFCRSGSTYEFIVNNTDNSVTAKILAEKESTGDFIYYNNKFQEIAANENDDPFYLKDLSYSEGQGNEIPTNTYPGKCLYNIYRTLFEINDNDTVWVSWDVMDYGPVDDEWTPICVQAHVVTGLPAFRFEAEGNVYECEFSDDKSSVWCRKVVDDDKHDGERYVEIFEEVVDKDTTDPFYLSMADWTVEGTKYTSTWGYFQQMTKLFDSGITEIVAPWNAVTVLGKTEYMLVNAKITDTNTITFSFGGNEYKAVQSENPMEEPSFTCYLLQSSDKHDSERYLEIFNTTFGTTADDPFYFNMIEYGESDSPNYYEQDWEHYHQIWNLFVALAETNTSIVAPWAKEEYPNDSEYVFTNITLNPWTETLQFIVGGLIYNIRPFINPDSEVEDIWFACYLQTMNDQRDSRQYNEAFQRFIGRSTEAPFAMKSLNFTTAGTHWDEGTEEGQIIKKLVEDLAMQYDDFIYVTYDFNRFNGEIEYICVPLMKDDLYVTSFTVNGAKHALYKDEGEWIAKIVSATEDQRDSIVWNKEFQNRVGASDSNPFFLSDLPWTTDPGFILTTGSYYHNLVSRMFTADYVIHYPATWVFSSDTYGERYTMVDVLGNPGKIEFVNNGYKYEAVKENDGSIRITASYGSSEDTRDSDVYYKQYVDILTSKGATVFPMMLDYTWTTSGTSVALLPETPQSKAIASLVTYANTTGDLMVPVRSYAGEDGKTEYIMVPASVDDADLASPKGIKFCYAGTTYYTRYMSGSATMVFYKSGAQTLDITGQWVKSFYTALKLDPDTATFGLGDMPTGTYTSTHQYYKNMYNLLQAMAATPVDTGKPIVAVYTWRTLAGVMTPVFTEFIPGPNLLGENYFMMGQVKTIVQLGPTSGLTISKTTIQ